MRRGCRFRLIAARQNSRVIAQDHQPLGIALDGGLVERARNCQVVVLDKDSFHAGVLAAAAEQFDAVLATHSTILTEHG
jgi:hypothetical protein